MQVSDRKTKCSDYRFTFLLYYFAYFLQIAAKSIFYLINVFELKNLAFSSLFLLFILLLQGTFSQAQAIRLKVMAYNVHHCNPPSRTDGFIDMPAIARVINDADPDLVALQEIDVHTERSGKEINQAQELGRLTGMHHYFAKAIDYQGGEYGVAVLSKYPILEAVAYPLPLPSGVTGEPRVVAAVKVEIAKGTSIWFASTHLDLKEDTRVFQSERIIERFSSLNEPFILAGDFNAVPTSRVISLLDGNFTRTCLDDCEPTSPNINPRRTIDYIMYTQPRRVRTLRMEVIQETYASDHLPIAAVLSID